MTAKENIIKATTRFRILSEFRGALIQFTDTITNQCYLLRADKIAQDLQLIENFNSFDAMQIGYSAAYLCQIQSHEQKDKNSVSQNHSEKSCEIMT